MIPEAQLRLSDPAKNLACGHHPFVYTTVGGGLTSVTNHCTGKQCWNGPATRQGDGS